MFVFLRALATFFLPWIARISAWFVAQKIAWLAVRMSFMVAMLVAVIALVPVPDWVSDLPARIASLPPEFWWFAELVQFKFGVGVILAAYVFRFVLRRVLGVLGLNGGGS